MSLGVSVSAAALLPEMVGALADNPFDILHETAPRFRP
jgi:hypothetical protein